MEYVRIKMAVRFLSYSIGIIISVGIKVLFYFGVIIIMHYWIVISHYRLRFYAIDHKNLENGSVWGFMCSFTDRIRNQFITTQVSKSMDYQNLANKYNVLIIWLYGAAGHGKGLIDAMLSFGVKLILRKDIIKGDVWCNSEESANILE